MSELVFSFDNDTEIENSMNLAQSRDSTSLLSPSPSSSASQSEYVMISYDIRWECILTGSCESGTPVRSEATNKHEKERASPSPPATPSLYSIPQKGEQGDRAGFLSLQLNRPLGSTRPSTPEPTTPRTRRFQDSMLSLLSLLPPERYSSPSPSIEEGQFEERETRQYDSGAFAASPALPTHSTTADVSSENRSLFSSPYLRPRFPEDRSEFDDSGDGIGPRI
ncbi:hypothetical protein ANO14919_003100 [Xylariales sp. No.14919]|nr:hypothetical protein F5X98DRAFT_252800 [Xylaria grammica]GAW10972.1 hypothetical protein ANO14919_003100 [Xylariales sp. No.14919]